MSYTSIDVLRALALKAFNDSALLVKATPFDEALEFQFLEMLLYQAEGELDGVEIRRIWHVEDKLDAKRVPQVHLADICMSPQIIENYREPFSLLLGGEGCHKLMKDVSSDTTVMLFIVEETLALAYSCDHSSILGPHGFARDVHIRSSSTPLMREVGMLSEHDLVYINHLPLAIVGILHFMAHLYLELLIPSILCFLGHLSDPDYLPLDKVCLVDCSQAPRLDELGRELPVKEQSALLDRLGNPSSECLFGGQELDVDLVQLVLCQ